MAKRKKARKATRRRKQKKKRTQYAALKHKLRRSPFSLSQVVVEPRGQIRMSEVLEAFVEPYVDLAETEEALHKLLTVAIAAWNISLLPADEQKAMVDQMANSQSDASRRDKRDLRRILYDLIERKRTHFADNRRAIVDFHLRDEGDDLQLLVASTLLPPEQAPDSGSTQARTPPGQGNTARE
jgi:hypothetical protein